MTLDELIAEVDRRWPKLEFLLGRSISIKTGEPSGWFASLGGVRVAATTPSEAVSAVIWRVDELMQQGRKTLDQLNKTDEEYKG